MKTGIRVVVLLAAGSAALGAQQRSPYEGTSNPPANDQIVATPEAKPQAGRPANAEQDGAAPGGTWQGSGNVAAGNRYAEGGSDARPIAPTAPALSVRPEMSDPDGDIVHPRPLRRGELAEGTTIRVHLLNSLSTVTSEKGEPFRTAVATDVVVNGEVVIPAGSEIAGRVTQVSSGHAGGYGSMRLQPETVTLANGSRYVLHAETTGTPGAKTRVVGEGTIRAGSRWKKDGIEYGGAVGAGAVTGAFLGGPVGAATGSLIGAGAITVHLLVSHPQARLNPGTTILFTLTDPLYIVPAGASWN